jgi:hypothetical protein
MIGLIAANSVIERNEFASGLNASFNSFLYVPTFRPPRRTEIPTLNTRKLFNRTASVLGRPRRTEIPTPNTRKLFSRSAAEDGRAPTEELSCVRGIGTSVRRINRNITISDSRVAT